MSKALLCLPALLLFAACSGRQPELPSVSFRDAAEATGLHFHHFTGATGEFYLPEITGSGVALIDYDGDGDLDIFLVQCRVLDPSKTPADARFPPQPGAPSGNRLFRNDLVPGGRLHFTDVTEQAGLAHVGYGMGAAVGDFDGDHRPDLYVTALDGNILYRNNGDGTFTDVTAAAGVRDGRWSTGAAFVDYNRDGRPDLFVARYVDFSIRANLVCPGPGGERDYCGPTVYPPMTARLYRNEGHGKFRDVSAEAGIESATGNGFGVSVVDFDGDGWPDIFVANDTTANLLWINRRDGTFAERGLAAGLAYNGDGAAMAGMGVAVEDFDGDGQDDIFVTNLTRQHNTLYRNLGRMQFVDATAQFHLAAPSLPYTGWGTRWFDFDNDGRLDLFVANGAVMTVPALRGEKYPYHQKNLLFWNTGSGPFQDVSAQAGPGLQLSDGSRGAAFGDIDNDGDVDIVVSNNDGPARLLLNETGNRRHWLLVSLTDAAGGDGEGARVGVRTGGNTVLWRRAFRDGSFLSASDVRVHFGLGNRKSVDGLVVRWPDGNVESFPAQGIDRMVKLKQGTGQRR